MSRHPPPPLGEPIDLAQAARLITIYLPGVRTELRAFGGSRRFAETTNARPNGGRLPP